MLFLCVFMGGLNLRDIHSSVSHSFNEDYEGKYQIRDFNDYVYVYVVRD